MFTTNTLVVQSAGAEPQLTTVALDSLREDELKVQIHATGVCHTNLACMAGQLPVQFPNVFGHEGLCLI
jgi:Zn-dependent alcohol dehydrogenase